MSRFLLRGPGPRPPCHKVAEHLWGADCDFDSDGDSEQRLSTDWTELTVSLRDHNGRNSDAQRVDVDPIEGEQPLVLSIRSDNPDLARRTAEFLQMKAGGELASG